MNRQIDHMNRILKMATLRVSEREVGISVGELETAMMKVLGRFSAVQIGRFGWDKCAALANEVFEVADDTRREQAGNTGWVRTAWGWTRLMGGSRVTVRGPILGKPMWWLYVGGGRYTPTGRYDECVHFATDGEAKAYADKLNEKRTCEATCCRNCGQHGVCTLLIRCGKRVEGRPDTCHPCKTICGFFKATK